MSRCNFCPALAVFRCSCSEDEYCERDMMGHLQGPGPHQVVKLSSILDPYEKSLLDNQLLIRIRMILECTKEVQKHTADLVKTICFLSDEAVSNLNKLMNYYQHLLKENKFSDEEMQDARKILKTSLVRNAKLENSDIAKYYAQDFFWEKENTPARANELVEKKNYSVDRTTSYQNNEYFDLQGINRTKSQISGSRYDYEEEKRKQVNFIQDYRTENNTAKSKLEDNRNFCLEMQLENFHQFSLDKKHSLQDIIFTGDGKYVFVCNF
jgi:hypothetical protein